MKLPKPRKRGHSYRIELMINGKRLSATRDTAKECEQWAASKLLEHKAGHNDEVVESSITVTLTLSELLKLYHENIGKYKRSQSDKFTKRILLRDYPELSQKQIHQITPKDLTLWRNSRLQSVKPSTVKREISYLSAVFSYAVKELFILTINPFSQVSKPTSSKPRNRRVTDNDIRLLKQAVDWTGTKPSTSNQWVVWAFLFAIETAMRRGEILAICRADIKENYIHLTKTKNGDSRNVPLNKTAKELVVLALSAHQDNQLIPTSVNVNTFRLAWERVRSKAKIKDLTFHDSRHEAISRFVYKYKMPVETLAKITGHKDLKILLNTYYNPTINEVLQMMSED
ncbi:tyrosine-type recombinase/integrase [Moraxella catarrhalis]|uniref:tyrosine-type recombinase/integrase n=1 Tax=Moraxella catarrhalis TaxID=480 RepID=UPI00128DCC23|nr:site-specific integrase [Moraxella catarrhalis]MPY08839.1 site-specific integrase [Moraxella catarrhalis]